MSNDTLGSGMVTRVGDEVPSVPSVIAERSFPGPAEAILP